MRVIKTKIQKAITFCYILEFENEIYEQNTELENYEDSFIYDEYNAVDFNTEVTSGQSQSASLTKVKFEVKDFVIRFIKNVS